MTVQIAMTGKAAKDFNSVKRQIENDFGLPISNVQAVQFLLRLYIRVSKEE